MGDIKQGSEMSEVTGTAYTLHPNAAMIALIAVIAVLLVALVIILMVMYDMQVPFTPRSRYSYPDVIPVPEN